LERCVGKNGIGLKRCIFLGTFTLLNGDKKKLRYIHTKNQKNNMINQPILSLQNIRVLQQKKKRRKQVRKLIQIFEKE